MQSLPKPSPTQSFDLSFQRKDSESALPQSAPTEQDIRVQLAAAYRLIDYFGMADLIYTHLSARVPGNPSAFLINPFGLLFSEITASNLVKVDLDGNILEDNGYGINPAGFVIHSAILEARHDINCVIHTHSSYGTAISVQESGLLPFTQFSMQFYNRVAYHRYEGVSLELDERERLVTDLGDRHAMILNNHGLLTVGDTIPRAFYLMYYLEKSCEIQILAQSSGAPLIQPSPDVCEKAAQQLNVDGMGETEWPAFLRMLDKHDSSYRH